MHLEFLCVSAALDRSREGKEEKSMSNTVESSMAPGVKPHSFGTRDMVVDLGILSNLSENGSFLVDI